MTLNTDVRITAPADPEAVFAFARTLLGDPATQIRGTYDEPYWGHPVIGNQGGQGLPAWLLVHHNDGALLEDDPEVEYPPGYVDVSFDTTYSYSDEYGGPGTLHARYVAQLGEWLDAQGLPWQWKDEYSGEWFSGYTDLPQLIGNGRDAQTWFTSILPALAAKIGFTPNEEGE